MDKKRTVPAGVFKQGCLALIDEVAEHRQEIIVTKRGKPVARLVPMEDAREHEQRLLASWRGKARQWVDDDELLRPTSELVGWRAATEDDA